MAVRFRTTFKNRLGVEYAVHIHDKEWTKAVPNYGLLYNWYAATDARNIAAEGWSVPTTAQWQALTAYFGSAAAASLGLKEAGTTYWLSATGLNSVGFNARGAGYRVALFSSIKSITYFRSRSAASGVTSDMFRLDNTNTANSGACINWLNSKDDGVSVRLIKDSSDLTHGQTGTYTGNDGKVYRTICIGTQEWLADNLAETQFRNGDYIPGFDGGVYTPISNAAWAAATTAMCCAYEDDLDNAYTTDDGDPIDYIAAGEGFELTQDGSGQTLYNPIIATSAMIYMHVQDVNRDAINQFLYDIVDSQDENRFTAVIYEDSILYFRGKVNVERISVPDRHFNQITINANDGFGRLRSLPYYDDGTLYTDWATVKEHIFNVLNKLDLFDYGGYLAASVVFATRLYVSSTYHRIFDEIRFQHDALKEVKADGTVLPFTCHDVLTQILTRFGLRIVQLRGEFTIQEFTAIAEMDAITTVRYDSGGVFDSTNPVTYNTGTIEKLSGGQSFFREPAKSVRLDYAYKDAIGGSNIADEVIPRTTWKNIGFIPSGNGERVAFNFDFSVIHTAAAIPTSVTYYITYDFSIRRNTSFLTNEGGLIQWQSDSSKKYSVTNMYEIDDPIDINLIHEVAFIIPEVPVAGDLYVYWDFRVTGSGGNAIVGTQPNGTDNITNLQNLIVILYSTTQFDENEGSIVTIASGAVNSGEQIELGVVVIGDKPFDRSIGRIQRNLGSSIWENTYNSWGHGGSETLTLDQLVTRELLSLQRKSTKLISYVIRSNYPGVGNKIQNNVALRASYSANSAIWNVDTFVPVINRDGVAYTAYVDVEGYGGTPGGIMLPPTPTPSTPNYWKKSGTTLSPATSGDKVEITATGSDNAIKGISDSGYGVNGISISGYGGYFSSTSGTGGYFASSSSYGLRVFSASGIGEMIRIYPSSTNSMEVVSVLQRGSSGTAEVGIGSAQRFDVQVTNGTSYEAGRFGTILTNVTLATLESAFVWLLRLSGAAAAEVMRLTGDGVLNVKSGFSVDETAAVADGTYTVGKGATTDGTITVKGGIITAITEAAD